MVKVANFFPQLAEASSAIKRVIRGKDEVIELALVSVLAGGHVLLEDIPGVGKTTLAQTLACVLGGSFKRIQFTSDLLPSDLLGVSILKSEEFEFRPGPIFANVVLADEVNRATPRTQSALLEAMNEHSVTVDGITRSLPKPFLVIATQNPFDFYGTFALPDSQLDRFLIRISMGYPNPQAEAEIIRMGERKRPLVPTILSPTTVESLIDETEKVQVHDELLDYILRLATRTRQEARLVRGVSTRAVGALYRAVKALALLRGRLFVIPEDIRELIIPVWAHRVLTRGEATPGEAGIQALQVILEEIKPPR